jgi:putative nucleotidyltransferase with HDIG domain
MVQLPVYPALALRVLALVARGTVSFAELSALVSKDQALAGHLIGAANSCIYSPVGQISTIAHAISYIGLEETRRIITAASLRPLFVSSGIAELWKHSIEMSRWCEEAARTVGGVSKDEAFLAGLVHDVGRLLALKHSGEASVAYVQLMEQGCDPPFAEASVFGCDHAELGADILMVWNFPEHMVEAVLNHHHPGLSRSALGGLLYLAESRNAAENPEPSTEGIQHALTVTGLTQESMASVQPEIGLLRSMSFAA